MPPFLWRCINRGILLNKGGVAGMGIDIKEQVKFVLRDGNIEAVLLY